MQQVEPKNGGVDRIHVKAMENVKEFIVKPLVNMTKTSISLILLPEALKYKELQPVFKEGDKFVTNTLLAFNHL